MNKTAFVLSLLLSMSAFFVNTASAQQINSQALSQLSPEQRQQLLQQRQQLATGNTNDDGLTQQVQPQSRTNWRTGTYGPVMEEMLSEQERTKIQPFAAELFDGGFRGMRSDGVNPNYRIAPGDQVTLRVWGATDMQTMLTVDSSGFIFIPSIGPVKVQGIPQNQLNTVISGAIKNVYREDVNVYTNLQGIQPVALMVTGYVETPGRYAGVPSDSILYFLDQANGIDNEMGSYRSIDLVREGEVIATFDLYDFLTQGQLQQPQLREGDTILVHPRGAKVTVYGDVDRAFHYELAAEVVSGSTLTELAKLKPGVSHALQVGTRKTQPFAKYQQLTEFAQNDVKDGDEVAFFADKRTTQIVVQLEGRYLSQSYFVLPKGARLMEFLNTVAVDPEETDYNNVSIRRQSVAERQQKALNESLDRLEQTYLGAPSSTAEEAAVRAQEAELISQFVAKARRTEPSGRLVVSHNGDIVDVRLQHGDVITLPARTDSVLISGEVYVPQSVVYMENKSVEDYIKGAGGLTTRADEDRILLVRQNGEVVDAASAELKPGDEILVLPAVSSKNIQLAQSISQILYQIAVATKVALDL